jgi:hypothetical protein
VTYYLVGGNLIKKPLCPNLNHSIPEVRTKRFNRGTDNGPKATHTLADLGNMLLLPKLAKQRKFDPCKSWAAVVPESSLKKSGKLERHKKKVTHRQLIFGNDGLTKVLGFCGT